MSGLWLRDRVDARGARALAAGDARPGPEWTLVERCKARLETPPELSPAPAPSAASPEEPVLERWRARCNARLADPDEVRPLNQDPAIDKSTICLDSQFFLVFFNIRICSKSF